MDKNINTMNNMEKLQLCYTDVLNTLVDLTGELAGEDDLLNFDDELALIEKTSVILKRLGETQVIEQVEQDIEVGDEQE